MQGEIRVAHGWVRDIEAILADYPRTSVEEKRPSQQVATNLDAYLRQLEARTDLPDDLAAWRDHLILIVRRLWPGLFACYDQPLLPRTNNDLEVFFGGLKRNDDATPGGRGPKTISCAMGLIWHLTGLSLKRRYSAACVWSIRPTYALSGWPCGLGRSVAGSCGGSATVGTLSVLTSSGDGITWQQDRRHDARFAVTEKN